MGTGQPPSSSTHSRGQRDNGQPGRGPRAIVASLAVLALAAAGLASVATASAASVTGTLVTNSLTRPGGGAYLPGGGGHFWVSDRKSTRLNSSHSS